VQVVIIDHVILRRRACARLQLAVCSQRVTIMSVFMQGQVQGSSGQHHDRRGMDRHRSPSPGHRFQFDRIFSATCIRGNCLTTLRQPKNYRRLLPVQSVDKSKPSRGVLARENTRPLVRSPLRHRDIRRKHEHTTARDFFLLYRERFILNDVHRIDPYYL
jgi:hypothetical protein